MEQYTNEKGEIVVIAQMDNNRLIHAIAKYTQTMGDKDHPLVKALKAEALKRLSVEK